MDIEKIERKAKLNGGRDAFPNEDGGGLTKREWFAGMALPGILANHESGSVPIDGLMAAVLAISDELLEQLAESEGAK
jgi:hypothetical protein